MNIKNIFLFHICLFRILFPGSHILAQENNPVDDPIMIPQTAYQDPYLRADWQDVSARQEIYTLINEIAVENPFYTRKIVYGMSLSGIPLIALEIHNYLESSESAVDTIIFACGIHPRETGSHLTGITTIISFLERVNDSNYLQHLLIRKRIIYLPVINPDGLEMLSQGYDWRKNASTDQGLIDPENAPYSFGVDLNRNFPSNYTNIPGPGNITYSGTAALTEPETIYLVNYLSSQQNIRSFIALHSYGERVVFPWFGRDQRVHNYDQHIQAGTRIAEIMGNYYLEQGYGYGISGNMGDWVYNEFEALCFTIELGDEFATTDEDIIEFSQSMEQVLIYIMEITN